MRIDQAAALLTVRFRPPHEKQYEPKERDEEHEQKVTRRRLVQYWHEDPREQAREEQTTLNEQFRQWLEQYARKRQAARAVEVMDRLGQYVATGGRAATRDELNERR